MNCKKLHAYFESAPQKAQSLRRDSAEFSEHLAACPECNRTVEEQNELAKSLKVLRDSVPAISPSLDEAVLTKYQTFVAEQPDMAGLVPFMGGRGMRRRSGWVAALALTGVIACASVFVFMPRERGRAVAKLDLRQPTIGPSKVITIKKETASGQGPARKTTKTISASDKNKVHRETVAEQDLRFPTRFQSLMYCDQLSCPGAMDVIRVQLPSPVLGVTPVSAQTNGLVSADVLVGPDGIARGIRLVE